MEHAQLHSCSKCAMSQICLPLGIAKTDVELLENLIQSSETLQANDAIFRQGERFSKVYAVKSGTFKSSRIDEQGNEHVTAFHLPGELIGLDGIYPDAYSSTTSALDTAVLCSMDYDELTELCTNIPALQRQLLRLLSRDIYESYKANAENADHTAAQKLASFLNNLSTRYEIRGYSALSFHLAMSRQDIASHLGLPPETVSRLLKRFKHDGLIDIENRHIELKDVGGLDAVVACANG
jgi:CRP/FNR family transcriptional regulator